MDVFDVIARDSAFEELTRLLGDGQGPVNAEGLWGSCAPILAALAARRLGRPLLLVAAHVDEADDTRDDVETAIGVAPDLLPALESLPGEESGQDELVAERLRLCMKLHEQAAHGPPRPQARRADPPWIIVAPIHALMQPVPSPSAIDAASLSLATGRTLAPHTLTDWLAARGFTRVDQVDEPGDFAVRGGIVDVFSHARTDPVRVEFFGDTIESIRLFDAGTQRSSHPVDAIRIPAHGAADAGAERRGDGRRPGAGGQPPDATTGFLAHLPGDTLIAFNEPVEIQELGRTYWQRLGEPAGIIPVDAVFRRGNDFTQLYLRRFGQGDPRSVPVDVGSLPQFEGRPDKALPALREVARELSTIVLCDTPAEQSRFRELLSAEPADLNVSTVVGVLHRGFRWRRTAFIPHHELFGRYRQRRRLRRVAPARPIDSFFDLSAGDHVVHVTHGIGRFVGLKTLEKDSRSDEYMVVQFAGDAVIHVPVSQVHLVQKYVGSFKGRPRLSRLGGNAWKRTKERVAAAVTDLAAELLSIQARRAVEAGVAYPADTAWQREFEGSFIYRETEDQLRGLADIKKDMAAPRPMDRLLCGDVGFGKTELAMRAAFKAVEFGKQVAVLVPTTVLAEQHQLNFRERFADYPFRIECLSRFRSRAEQARILDAARRGQVDIVIGTHRLLSKDVQFADLGLVVIDEEQRFGVAAKERLKQLRTTVDVLTLTATPIPRTLHMAMLGIKDISSLATPPLDRRAIVTQVRLWDRQLIRDAILRELNRDGQVYFVHNFVRDIEQIANAVREIVPEARVVVGHGQMDEGDLEDVILRFMRHAADVLVCTNIIESGIDIASANTIFIHRAERFGLADLHQLRGRVGRSKHRAYAYLLLSPKHPVNDNAAKRLKALEHYSHVGAGFHIAMRDLEIRGAGNILGSEQSGHIEAVGYEMYCQLLEQAVKRMRNEPAGLFRQVNLNLGVTAAIPKSYIRAERQRMEVYKRLAACRAPGDIDTLANDLRDAFGPPPPAVGTLLALAEIRTRAMAWGIRSIVLTPPDVVFTVDDMPRASALFSSGPGSPRMPDATTVHWRLPARYLEPGTLLTILRKQLSATPAPAPVA